MEASKNINQPKDASGAGTAPKKAASKKPQGGDASQSANQNTTNQNAVNQSLGQKAKETTGAIVDQVQQQANSQFSRQKENTANELSTVVNAVRRFGETLTNEGNGPIARYAADYGDKAAQSLERLTNYIREQEPKQLLNDVQNFGRRQPALLIGGAFLLGFAGARLIKSSMETGSQPQRGNGV
jgi:hypothetical protein